MSWKEKKIYTIEINKIMLTYSREKKSHELNFVKFLITELLKLIMFTEVVW